MRRPKPRQSKTFDAANENPISNIELSRQSARMCLDSSPPNVSKTSNVDRITARRPFNYYKSKEETPARLQRNELPFSFDSDNTCSSDTIDTFKELTQSPQAIISPSISTSVVFQKPHTLQGPAACEDSKVYINYPAGAVILPLVQHDDY